MEAEYITGMIKNAGRNGEIIFLQENDKNIMVDELAQFYLHFIGLFRNSEHVFDSQKEVKHWIEKYIIIDENNHQVDNYSFRDSKNDILIQLSDVVSGIYGQMYEYLNKTEIHSIARDVKQMDDQQLRCASLLCSLIYRASYRNQGFIFSITAQSVRDRFEHFAKSVEAEKRLRRC